MLVSLTRVGASRQTFAKAFAVVGADPGVVDREFRRSASGGAIECGSGTPGLFTIRAPATWLGTRHARNAAFTGLAGQLADLADIARRCGGRLAPTAVAVGAAAPVLGGDEHVTQVTSAVEQEVLCNLLRIHAPALIAMTGRGVAGAGRPPDRVGSRWLADSRSHLATRYLASTADEHLERVKAELRRSAGVAQLERMDIAPRTGAGGGSAVVVRCTDAAVGLAGLRMQAVVLAALAMSARRRVRGGGRAGNSRQQLLEQNRARAVALGLRAQFAVEPRGAARTRSGHGAEPPRLSGADTVVRRMLDDLTPEFRNLEVGVEELAPALLAIDMARFGSRIDAGEGALVREWAAGGEALLLDRGQQALIDPEPGGELLRQVRARAGGTVAAILRDWRERIENTGAPSGPTNGRPAGRRHSGAAR